MFSANCQHFSTCQVRSLLLSQIESIQLPLHCNLSKHWLVFMDLCLWLFKDFWVFSRTTSVQSVSNLISFFTKNVERCYFLMEILGISMPTRVQQASFFSRSFWNLQLFPAGYVAWGIVLAVLFFLVFLPLTILAAVLGQVRDFFLFFLGNGKRSCSQMVKHLNT